MAESKDMKVIDQAPEDPHKTISRLQQQISKMTVDHMDDLTEKDRRIKSAVEYNKELSEQNEKLKSGENERMARYRAKADRITGIVIVAIVAWGLYNIVSTIYNPSAPSIIGHALGAKK